MRYECKKEQVFSTKRKQFDSFRSIQALNVFRKVTDPAIWFLDACMLLRLFCIVERFRLGPFGKCPGLNATTKQNGKQKKKNARVLSKVCGFCCLKAAV